MLILNLNKVPCLRYVNEMKIQMSNGLNLHIYFYRTFFIHVSVDLTTIVVQVYTVNCDIKIKSTDRQTDAIVSSSPQTLRRLG